MATEEETLAAASEVVRPFRGVNEDSAATAAKERADALPARPELSKLAVGVVADVLVKLLNNQIPVKKAVEAKQVVETCYAIIRLEAGEATSIGHLTYEEILADVSSLRDKTRRDMKITPPKPT